MSLKTGLLKQKSSQQQLRTLIFFIFFKVDCFLINKALIMRNTFTFFASQSGCCAVQ